MKQTKIVRLGMREIYKDKRASVYCKIEFDGKKLSISGVEGPLRGGNAIGSCGQIDMHLGVGADITPAPEWTSDKIAAFLAIWERWHLNDMRAGCEHQRAAWEPEKKLTLVTWRLTSDALTQQTKVKREVDEMIREHGSLDKLAPWTHMIYKAPFEITLPAGSRFDYDELYKEHKREEKTAGWVYPSEHPEGLLTKPCDVCGYKYGSAWLHEDVPADVITWLFALPDTDVQPAWV